MDKFVVVSTNNNPGYYYYAPLAEYCWNRLGYRVALFITDDVDIENLHLNTPDTLICKIPSFPTPEGRDTMSWHGTLAQVVRHFATAIVPQDSYIITSDIDMLPLTDFLQPDTTKRTVWGWDLTDKSFIPVSYVGMKWQDWRDVMGNGYDLKADMEKAMKLNGRAYQSKWEQYWDADWEILTTHVMKQKDTFQFIDRGRVNLANVATAKYRGDRYYDATFKQDQIWDLHLETVNPAYPEKFTRMEQAMKKMWGTLPQWMYDHAAQHYAKYGQ